jgi:hypothetical protein
MSAPHTNTQAVTYLTVLGLPSDAARRPAVPDDPPVERRTHGECADEASPQTRYGRRLNDVGQERRRYLEYV